MISEREAFEALQLQLDVGALVWLDEAGANLAMTPTYGRAPAGERVVEYRPSSRKGKTSLIAAISLDGVVAYDMVAGSYNGERFLAWLTTALLPKLRSGTSLIWDNVRFHGGAAIREAVETAGCMLIKFPPYSPDLTPIEECWSKVKHLMRRAKARTHEALRSAMDTAIAAVTPVDISGWVEHAGYHAAAPEYPREGGST